MKPALLAISTFLTSALFSQESFEGRWIPQIGASTVSFFKPGLKQNTILNLRYVSPRFRISNEDWTAEEEKEPERFKNGRVMLELLYAPPLHFLGTSFNIQYRFINFKRFTMDIYGGIKFFFITPSDYVINPNSSANKKDIWYVNPGLICQLDLGKLKPFVDIGYDGVLTVGAEIDLYKIVKKIRRKTRTPYLHQ